MDIVIPIADHIAMQNDRLIKVWTERPSDINVQMINLFQWSVKAGSHLMCIVVCVFRCLTRQKIIDTGSWWTVLQTFVSGMSRYIHTYRHNAEWCFLKHNALICVEVNMSKAVIVFAR